MCTRDSDQNPYQVNDSLLLPINDTLPTTVIRSIVVGLRERTLIQARNLKMET